MCLIVPKEEMVNLLLEIKRGFINRLERVVPEDFSSPNFVFILQKTFLTATSTSVDEISTFLDVRPAWRRYLEVKVLYAPGKGKH